MTFFLPGLVVALKRRIGQALALHLRVGAALRG